MENEAANIEGSDENLGGDTAEMQITTVSSGETETILIVLTMVFLLIAIGLMALKLYSSYDFFKDETEQTASIQ